MAVTHQYEFIGVSPEPEDLGGPDLTLAGFASSAGFKGGFAQEGTSAASRAFVSDHSWPIYHPGANNFSWRAMIKIDAVDTQRRGIVTDWEDIGGNNRGWGLFVEKDGAASHENELYLTTSETGAAVYAADYGPDIVGAGWKHLVVVRDGLLLLGYVDNVLVMSCACPATLNAGSTFAYVLGSGGFPWGRDGGLYCHIDKMQVWNTALTPAEVSADYVAVLGASPTTPFAWTFTTADGTAPTVVEVSPTGIDAPVDEDVVFDVTDSMSGVDLATLNVDIHGSNAIVNGVAQLGYSLATSPIVDGHRVTVGHPVLPGLTLIVVAVTVDDNDGNSVSPAYSWNYTTELPDTQAPFLANQDPAPGESGVASSASIEFSIQDNVDGKGVELSSIDVTVNGVDAIINGVVQVANFAGSITPDGLLNFDIVLDPVSGVLPEGAITIEVYAEDKAFPANVLDTPYSFSTIVAPPTIEDKVPAPGIPDADPDTAVTFSVRDAGGSGIDVSTLNCDINGTPAIVGGVAQPGFSVSIDEDTGTPELDYEVSVTPDTPFNVGDIVQVDIEVYDLAISPQIATASYSFAVGVEKPVAVLAYDNLRALIGSIIQLDGRGSYDPGNLPITFHWSFSRQPRNSVLDSFGSIWEADRAVQFIPDQLGVYEVQLVVNNGFLDSDPATAIVDIGLSEVPCGQGIVPDASMLWQAISNFWNLVQDRKYIESIWSATMQMLGADLVRLWANDYSKSLKTIGDTVPRYWQKFNLHTDVSGEAQRVIVGYTNAGTRGHSGDVAPTDVSDTIAIGTVAVDETFTGTISVPDGGVVIPGSVEVWLGAVKVGEDDGSNLITGVGGYGVSGQVDYDNGAVTVAESGNVWGAGAPVVVTSKVDIALTNQFYIDSTIQKLIGTGAAGSTDVFKTELTEAIGTGTASDLDAFSATLTKGATDSIIPGSVTLWAGATQVAEDDGEGNIVGVSTYNVIGTIDYASADIEVEERGSVWGVGIDCDVKYHYDILRMPVERRVAAHSVSIRINGDGTPDSGVEVATDDGSGNIVGVGGNGVTGVFDYDLATYNFYETTSNVFDVGDSVHVQFDIENTDLTTLDANKNAAGRLLVVNDEAYPVKRVHSTADASVVVVEETTIPGGLTNANWRIPHLLQVPAIDLEDFKVSAGDIVVFEVRRNDINISAELQAQVVGVSGDKVGFEFTLDELEPHSATIDRGQFQQLAQDLKLVPRDASDERIAAAAEALLAYMPRGINLSTRPFTPFRLTMKADRIIHNVGLRIFERYISIPSLQEEVFEPPVVLRENWDYIVGEGELVFQPGLFSLQSPAPETLWAECTVVDNSEKIEANFGRLVGIGREDLEDRITRVSYLSAVKGLWYAMTSGPTVANIRLGLQILLGLPYAEERGIILHLKEDFSTDPTGIELGRMLVADLDENDELTGRRRYYFYPKDVGLETNPATGSTYAEGDIIDQWAPISKGVEVEDYVKSPDWWRRTLAGQEILKYFIFRASIDGDVFDIDDVQFALDFLNKIKPKYTKVLVTTFKELVETPMDPQDQGVGVEILPDTGRTTVNAQSNEVTDKISYFGGHLQLYDNVGWGLPVFRLNHLLSQGVPAWPTGGHPFMLKTTDLLRDITTREGTPDGRPGEVVAESASGWALTSTWSQVNLGAGSGSLNDVFSATLAVPAGSQIVPGTVVIRKNGTGDPGVGDETARDDGNGVITGAGVQGSINYVTGELLVAEAAQQVWDAGDTVDADWYTRGTPSTSVIRPRQAGDAGAGTEFPVREGDLLILHKGQHNPGYSLFEIGEVLTGYKVVLRSVAGLASPETYDTDVLDAVSFQYGSALRGCVVRRMINPLSKGEDLVTSSAGPTVTSAGALFLTDGIIVDDHLVIEEGVDAGEYRVKDVSSETGVELANLDGSAPSFADATDIRFRVVKPVLFLTTLSGARSYYNGGATRTEIEVMDPGLPGGAPPGTPMDVFTPDMVGMRVDITGSDNPVNNGSFTITAYVNPGRVAIDSAVGAGSDDTAAAATIKLGPKSTATSWKSGFYKGFENVQEMLPDEVVEAELTT
jgi:hypothetical protein